MLRAFVVPHAPLLLDLPGRPHPAPGFPAAASALQVEGEIILVTPHGKTSGVYGSAGGDLGNFGVPDQRAAADTNHQLAVDIAQRWGQPLLELPLDHGAVVPLAMMGGPRAVVCALPEWTGQQERDPMNAVAAALGLATAIGEFARERVVSVVVSAHTSAAITARAPLTERSEGKEMHEAILSALAEDPARLLDISTEMFRRAGSCSAGAWTVLGGLTRQPLELLTEGFPFGVGYVVARSR